MLDDLENRQSNNSKETYNLILNCFMNLSFIDYVVANNYINSEHIEKLIKFITIDSISACHSNLIKSSMPFLINFFIKSFELSIYDNFMIFTNEKSEIIKSLFSILINLTNSSLYSEENFIIAFLISLFFITISIKSTVWEILNEKKILKPCCDFIKKFIYDTFNKKYLSNKINYNETTKIQTYNDEDLNEENEINKKILNDRFIVIKLLGRILGFFSKEKIFQRIFHIELFRYIFDFAIDLFHVDFTEINYDVYRFLNVCTYYNDCKLYLYIENEKKFKIIRKDLFLRIRLSLQNYNYLRDSINKNEETKRKSNEKRDEVENEEIKQNLSMKLNLFEAINEKSRIFAALNFRDFTILMSILSNLLIMNEFPLFKRKLLKNFDFDFDFDQFKKDLIIFIEDFDKRSNYFSRVINFDKNIHPVKIFLLIIDPMIKFKGKYIFILGEKKSDLYKREKKINLDILKDLKRLLISSEKDIDSYHKVLFIF